MPKRASLLLLVPAFWLAVLPALAQPGACPPNLDLELGNFTNWQCKTGNVTILSGQNTLNIFPSGAVPGQHTIINRASAGTDPFGGFSEASPNGSQYSVKLGNTGTGAQAEAISYTYNIPASATVFSIFYQYAVVFQNPGHAAEEQPRFRARIIDLSTNNPIPCVDFDFTASSSLPGFRPSAVSPTVLYKDWTPITLNLSGYAGRTIMLEFITSDCTRGGHFGYAYLDVNSQCDGVIDGSTLCAGFPTATLTAPFGFQSYEWYSDNTFTTQLATTQVLNLNPPPAVGSVLPVVVIPFPSFGCRDTLYATIDIVFPPTADAGADRLECRGQTVTIGSPPVPGVTYQWTPGALVSNPAIANPTASNPGVNPIEFIVRATDPASGCYSQDTMLLSPRLVDTALQVTGRTSFCAGDPVTATLTVQNPASTIQWYNGALPLPGETGLFLQPTVSGLYWALLQQNGCTDSTRKINVTVNPLPVSVAGPDAPLCRNQLLQLGTAPNPAYTYLWTPASQVSDPTAANPFAVVTAPGPVRFVVQTTDPAGGCSTTDTVVITGVFQDTSLQLTGRTSYCVGAPDAGQLTVINSAAAVQWYSGLSPIPGATGLSYQPTTSGSYWAQLSSLGCTDSTRQEVFLIQTSPRADYTVSRDTGCVNTGSFAFTNRSSVSDGSPLNYTWRFSDGSTLTDTDPVKTFSTAGLFSVRLVARTDAGCADSTAWRTLRVMPNARAGFSWDSVCVDRPVQFVNRSQTNGSPAVNYEWNFGAAAPVSPLFNPPPVTYSTGGLVQVTLKAIALGCEDNPDSVTRQVMVNEPAPGIRYRDLTVPQGTRRYLSVRDTVGRVYDWTPRIQLNRYNDRYVEFTATDDVLYLVRITGANTCVTTDTVPVFVLKKPGYYLPTAFTPNGDGLNDVARPYLVGMQGLKSFSIFNRWGKLIYQTRREGDGWNGKFQDIDQDAGVYVWMLEFYDASNRLVTQKGTITLIR